MSLVGKGSELPHRVLRPVLRTSKENNADEAALSGATLALRAMEPRAQLVQSRCIQRKRRCGKSVRRCTDRSRQARAAPRPRPHLGAIAGKLERRRFMQTTDPRR